MAALIDIPGIGKSSRELLEAVGFSDPAALATADGAGLMRELERANQILKICKRPPTESAVAKWIENARELCGVQPVAAVEPEGQATTVVGNDSPAAVDFEQSAQVAVLLAAAPFAIPLPARTLVENTLGVSDVPAAIVLNHHVGDLEVRVDRRVLAGRQAKPVASNPGYVRLAENQPRVEIDTSKMRSTGDLGDAPAPAPVAAPDPEDRLTLLRTPRVATNVGRDPQSRWYIRGVLHTHPVSIYLGALATLLVMGMIPLAVAAAVLLLASGEMPDRLPWVPAWFLIFPGSLPLLGLFYLIWGVPGNCRVCGQKLFVHRPHLKNSRAHHVPIVGYIIPLCLHIALFRWFRCTHCGTPVRLKK